MKHTHIILDIPANVHALPIEAAFTQAELNFMLDGTRRSIEESYRIRKMMKARCSTLWPTCDKSNPETLENYKLYLSHRTHLKRLNKDIKRMESISRKLKLQRQLTD